MPEPLSGRTQSAATKPEAGALEDLWGDELATTLRETVWSEAPDTQLGRVMARRDVDLVTALCVFFHGAPERFNYVPKRHVPEGYRSAARHLDNICLRINSGFYLPAPDARLECRDTLDRWLDYQRADRQEGRCGRWVLDETVLMPLFDAGWYRAPLAFRPEREAQSVWRALLGPLRDLRLSRSFGRSRK